ncbi:MAG: tRNA-binding protein [Vulcanimicrobiaceae bacterium]
MEPLRYEEFERVEIRAGTILSAEEFPQARKPAYRLEIDFGEPIGRRRSSAQLPALYSCAELVGRQVLAVVNFPPKRIAGFSSEVLTLGVDTADGNVVLIRPDRPVPNGARLY